jgi:hypothetical protein
VTFPAGAICHPGLGQELDTWTSQTPSLLLRWPLVLPSVLDRSGTFQGLVWCLPIGFCHRRWDVEVEGEDSSDPLWTGQGLKQCKAHGTCDFPQPRQRPPLKAQEKVWDAERPTKLLVTRQLRLLGPRSQHCQSPHSFSFLHGGPSGKHKSHLCSQQPLERCLKSESSAASPVSHSQIHTDTWTHGCVSTGSGVFIVMGPLVHQVHTPQRLTRNTIVF